VTESELLQLKALFYQINLRQRYEKSLLAAETVHRDHIDLIKAFEIDFDLKFGLEVCEDMLKDIESWKVRLKSIQMGANKIAKRSSELPEAEYPE